MRRAVATTSGRAEQDLLYPSPDLIGLGERGARQRVHADRQAPLLKLRQKRSAEPRHRQSGGREEQQRDRRYHDRTVKRVRQSPGEACFQRAGQPPLVASYNRGGTRQERKAERGRDDNRHAKRRQQRHDVAYASGVSRRPSTPDNPKIGRNTRTMMTVANTIDVRISTVASHTTTEALGAPPAAAPHSPEAGASHSRHR